MFPWVNDIMSRKAEMILGVIGGIFGILMGIFAVVVGGIGSAFDPHDASSALVSSLGLWAVIFGVLGIVGGAVVNKNKKMAGGLMLACGLLGFIAISMFWIIPGLLLFIGGTLTFLTKDENVMNITN